MTPAEKQSDTPSADSATIASGITGVVNAALSVGAAVARTVAAATSPGNVARPGAAGEGPFADIVHYSVEVAANFARLVVQGVNARPQPSASPSAAQPARVDPTVHAGSILRIPLSIENPSEVEMADMTFYCESLTYQGTSPATPLAAEAFKFQPASLTIAPHDFEKITIFIATEDQTAPGIYIARIMVKGGAFESPLRFEVLAAAQADS